MVVLPIRVCATPMPAPRNVNGGVIMRQSGGVKMHYGRCARQYVCRLMERIAAKARFPRRWASDTFNDLLKGRVEKKPKKPTANHKAG